MGHRGEGGERRARLAVVAVVWLAGALAGFYAMLGLTVRYGCGASDTGLACADAGTAVALALVVTVVAVVSAVTVLAGGRTLRAVVVLGAGAVLALALVYAGARLLLHTV